MDRERYLNIPKDTRVGPKTIKILRVFWDRAELAVDR